MPAPQPTRLSRLQFSLRAMLLLMALVGVALTIYRWPWVKLTEEQDSFGDPMQVTTTYRRGWNGKPLKHGMRVSKVHGPSGYRDDELFLDDELRMDATYNSDGSLIQKKHHVGGRLHGPCLEWGGDIQGQYDRGFKVGKWTKRHFNGRVALSKS